MGAEPLLTAADIPVQRRTPLQEAWRRFRKNRLALLGAAVLLVVAVVAIGAAVLTKVDPTATDPYHNLLPPSGQFPFGTDSLGRDLLTRVMYGARVSMQVGLISVAVGIVLGVPLGAMAGWSGRVADEIIMRVLDILMAFPPMILAIAVMGALGPKDADFGWVHVTNLGKITAVIGAVLIPPLPASHG